MRYSVFASILPLLAAAAPEEYTFDFEKRSPNPQLQALIPLALGGLTLGALSVGAGAVAAGALNGGARECSCGRQFQPPPCSGSLCECQNTANIACWAKEQGKCKINLKVRSFANLNTYEEDDMVKRSTKDPCSCQVCPSGNGQAGAPTSLNSEYPPCGQGLPGCQGGKVCQKLDQSCRDARSGGCIGLCIPNFAPQAKQPWWQEPKGYNPKNTGNSWGGQNNNGWKFGGNQGNNVPKGSSPPPPRCPASYSCQQDQVCVIDPHDTLAAMRGPSFKCVAGTGQGICGGFENRQCGEGLLCVPDPRLQCIGQGCTGLCA